MSVYLLTFFGAASSGSLFWGYLARGLGIRQCLLASAGLLLVGTVTAWLAPLRTGETFALPADQVFKAIGQTLAPPAGVVAGGRKLGAAHLGGKIWAGGDCARGGEDLTVTDVAEGRDAAEAIHAALIC